MRIEAMRCWKAACLTVLLLPLAGSASGQSSAAVGPCQGGKAKQLFDCSNVDLVSMLSAKELGAEDAEWQLNEVWGWTDPKTGREFALVGRRDGAAFVEVTDPAKPVYLGELLRHDLSVPNLGRGIKVYKNYAFITAEGAEAHGMQVFDLTQLLDVKNPPVVFHETAHYDRIHSAHSLVLNEETGYAYPVGGNSGGETCGGGLHMIDIRNPLAPTFAGCYAEARTGRAGTGYIHDAQCVVYHGPDQQYQGREICLNSAETALSIADVTDKKAPKTISIATYPNIGYTHQGWLTEDQRYFFLNDELDEMSGTTPQTRTIVFDVSDLDEPVVVKEWLGRTAAIDHNLYIRGRYMYQSNYKAGLAVVDVSDPKSPKEVGYFDITPDDDNGPEFGAAFTSYPFFKSGVVAMTGMDEGLFLLRFRPPTP